MSRLLAALTTATALGAATTAVTLGPAITGHWPADALTVAIITTAVVGGITCACAFRDQVIRRLDTVDHHVSQLAATVAKLVDDDDQVAQHLTNIRAGVTVLPRR